MDKLKPLAVVLFSLILGCSQAPRHYERSVKISPSIVSKTGLWYEWVDSGSCLFESDKAVKGYAVQGMQNNTVCVNLKCSEKELNRYIELVKHWAYTGDSTIYVAAWNRRPE
jgi:hypothetical protein